MRGKGKPRASGCAGSAASVVIWNPAGIAWPEELGHLHLIELSLAYPLYYVAVSLWLGGMQRRARKNA